MPATPTRARVGRLAAALAAAGVFATARAADDPSGFLRDGFEGPNTGWTQEQTDATIRLDAHDRTPRAAHEGRTSEHVRFQAGLGSAFYVGYAVPRVPVADDLKASLYVRANRVGAQLFARIVLPADTDPDTKQPSFLLIPGTVYDNVDRWQRLELLDVKTSVERQARVLRVTSRRPVSLEGAFVEQIVVNLFSGSGETEVFLDELSVGPAPEAVVAEHAATVAARGGTGPVADANPPAPGAEAAAPERPGAGNAPPEDPPAANGRGSARVRLDRNRLKQRAEDGLFHDWIFTAIDAPGGDVASLRNAGFDVLVDDLGVDPKRWQDAVARGFLLMPQIGRGRDGALPDPGRMVDAASAFPYRSSVAAWHLGDRLGRAADPRARDEELERTRKIIAKLRGGLPEDVSRLTTGLVDDDFPRYARVPRNLDLLGVEPTPWGGSMGLKDAYWYLRERRDLTARANVGAFHWAMLPASPPAAVKAAVWGQDVPPAWGNPVVQPEQLRLMTYATLAAGYRGIAFRGDADLTRGPGRISLLEMSLLNAEIDLFESILANGSGDIPFYDAYRPDPSALPTAGLLGVNKRVTTFVEQPPLPTVKAAGVGTRDRKGVLLLVTEFDPNGQFQPSQMARNDMKLTVIVPEGAQAFEVAPGRFRALEQPERVPGGTRITIPEFDTTALILVTTDVAMAERVEAVVNSIRPRAVQLAIEQAELKLAYATEVNGRLYEQGHHLIGEKERKKREANGGSPPRDEAQLLQLAAENIKAARENLERENYADAWAEARRASRPLRHLMRGHWENALEAMIEANMDPEDVANDELLKVGRATKKGPPLIVPPVASAPLVSFNLLPQHYLWVDWMKTAHFGRNLIPSGSFDEPDSLEKAGWANQGYQIDRVKSKVSTVKNNKKGTRRLVKMTVEPAEPGTLDELPSFVDFPAAAIRSPAVKVKAGQFLRIAVWVKRDIESGPGVGGVIVRDSLGGDALQFVSNGAISELTRVVLYRRAAADGDLTVTLGLAGYGEAFFDDLSVERVEAVEAAPPPDVARGRNREATPASGGRVR